VRCSGDDLEQTFVVATWDQRGTGKSYTMAVQRSPRNFAAYVGTGQMADPFATDKLMYAETIRDAQARGAGSTVKTLQALGEPPYDDILDYPVAIASNPKWINFTPTARTTARPPSTPAACSPRVLTGRAAARDGRHHGDLPRPLPPTR
jgi:hypothetical protein